MARLQIEENLDGDAMLPGGRTTVHRLSVILSKQEAQDVLDGKPVKLSEKLPALTVNHLYLDLKVE